MFERDRRPVIALGLLIAGLTLYAFFRFALYQGDHASEREADAKYQAADAGQQVEAQCVQVPDSTTLQCVFDPSETAQGAGGPNYDLKAQQDMAEWAYAAQWASVFGVMITGLGVIYVALTLNETRKATRAANKAADAALAANEGFAEASKRELRAYVHVSAAAVSDCRVGAKVRFTFQVKNFGQTPAHNVRWVAVLSFIGSSERNVVKFGKMWDTMAPMSLGPDMEAFHHSTMEQPLTQAFIDLLKSKTVRCYYSGVVLYRDTFGVDRRTVFQSYISAANLETGSGGMTVSPKHNKAS